jgi:hypothetical protein
MKRLLVLFVIVSAGALAKFASAQTASGTTFVISPSTQSVGSNSSFTVSISLTGTTPPANIAAFDLYLVTSSANSGLFSITSYAATGPFSIPSGSFTSPDAINDNNSADAANGFVINHTDLGFGGTAQNSPYNFPLETLTISTGVLTPGATYTFFTSTVATTGSNQLYSDVTDNIGNALTVPQAQFSITAVPEPATWSLLSGGGLLFASLALRRKRVA